MVHPSHSGQRDSGHPSRSRAHTHTRQHDRSGLAKKAAITVSEIPDKSSSVSSSPPSPHPIPAPTVPPHPTSRDFWPHPPLQKHRYPEVGIRGCCQRVSKGCSEPGVPTSVLASTARVELDREKVMVSREKFESKRQRPPPGDFERYVPDSQRLVPCAAVNLKIGP